MTALRSATSTFFVAGGTLGRDAVSYVPRQADDDLVDGLSNGDFCYVLTSRQMGKSSLMVRTASRLREAGAAVVVLDLTAIGQNLTAEQWYDGLLERVGAQLGLEDELDRFWTTNPQVGPLRRWMRALEEVALPSASGPIVVFVDEIDAVRSLPFSTDEFFAAIRELYNRRTVTPALERLTFCLLGVASPSDLIRDTRTTPFNIGRRVELGDFRRAEAAPLAVGLSDDPATGQRLLERVLHWTGGHPYLTQRLCREVVETSDDVDTTCERLFLAPRARERDDNLLFVRERLLRSEVDVTSLLELFEKVRAGRRVADDVANPLVSVLSLAGITRVRDDRLVVRNRIYREVFDRAWIRDAMPEAERRRQRAAYRRGILRATAVAAAVLVVIAALAVVAVRQRNEAQTQRRLYRALLYASQMNLAQQAWDADNTTRVVEILNGLQPADGERDLRDFEWYSLWRLVHRERLVVKLEGGPFAVAVSPDGARVAAAQGDGFVPILDLRDGHEVLRIAADPDGVRTLAYAPNGRTLATAGSSDFIRLWDPVTGAMLAELPGHHDGVRSLAFSKDGALLVSGGRDGAATVWDVVARTAIRTIAAHDGVVGAVALSPDGRMLATAGYDGRVRLWNPATGASIADLAGHPGVQVWSAAFSPDGRFLATGAWDNTAKLWDVATQAETATFRHSDLVTNVAFSPDGRTLATASYDMTIRLWDPETRAQTGVLKGHTNFIFGMTYAADGGVLATVGKDLTLRVWDAHPAGDTTTLAGNRDSIWCVAFSPDGRLLATADGTRPPAAPRGQVRIWDVAAAREAVVLDGPRDTVRSVAFSPDGRTLVAGSADGSVRLWDTTTWIERASIDDVGAVAMSVAYSSDGRLLVVAVGGSASIRDASTLGEIRRIEASESDLWHVALSPDGSLLATAGSDAAVRVWSVATGARLAESNAHTDAVFNVMFSPDGAILASASNDGTVKLWSPRTLAELATLKGHRGWVWGLAFSPDGRRLATGSLDTSVKLWDIETRQEVSSYVGHSGLVTSVAFSPDGNVLASAASGPADRTVRLRHR